jgi:tetratricopeptide (TPR) repeat protein
VRTLTAALDISRVRSSQGKLHEAREILLKVIDAWPKDQPNDLILLTAVCNLGFVYYKLGDLENADRHTRDALFRRREVLGDKHEDTIASYINMADIYGTKGEFRKAERILRNLLGLRRLSNNPSQPAFVLAESNLATLLLAQKDAAKSAEALAMLEHVLEVHRATSHHHTELYARKVAETKVALGLTCAYPDCPAKVQVQPKIACEGNCGFKYCMKSCKADHWKKGGHKLKCAGTAKK